MQHPTRPALHLPLPPSRLFFLRRRDNARPTESKGEIEKEEGREKAKVEERTKCVTIIKKREHKSMELSTDRTEKDKKSLVSLVSSTRLKGQMESQ